MPKDKLTDYSATNASNTDVGGVNIDEGMLPSAVNNALRELLTHLKEFSDGTSGIDVLSLADDDASAAMKLQAPASVTSDTTLTLPDGDGDSGQTLITNGSGTLSWAAPYGNRNLIINGAMQVAQRSTSVTGIGGSAGYFTVDRFDMYFSGTAGRLTQSQADVTDLSGFAHALKLDCTTADTSIAAGEIAILQYAIEGQDLQQFKKGYSDAESFTVSFYVKGNASATYTIELQDNDNSRQNTQTFDVTTGWTRVVKTFSPDTTGKFGNDNGASLRIQIYLQAGSDYTGGTFTSNTWASISNANTVKSDQTMFFDSTDRTLEITGVQLEVGEQATPFEHRSFGEELARCQRYYWQVAGTSQLVGQGFYYSSGEVDCIVHFPQTMRATPTFTSSNNSGDFGFMNNSDNFDTWTAQQFFDGSRVNVYTISGVSGTTGYAGYIRMLNATSKIQFDAEL